MSIVFTRGRGSRHSGAGGTPAVTSPVSQVPSQTVPAAVSIPMCQAIMENDPEL